MKAKIQHPIQPDWWSKTIAGGVLGFTLALMIGCLVFLIGRPFLDASVLPQIAMWSIPWSWLPIFFACYFIPRGWQAILIMLFANLLAGLAVFLLRGAV